jgi:hypothetical protein
MGDIDYLSDGYVLPAEGYRQIFANDLRETIIAQILCGQETVREKVDRQMLSCRLPKGEQLLDFTTLRATENPNELEISLSIPSSEDDEQGFLANFVYQPPR